MADRHDSDNAEDPDTGPTAESGSDGLPERPPRSYVSRGSYETDDLVVWMALAFLGLFLLLAFFPSCPVDLGKSIRQ